MIDATERLISLDQKIKAGGVSQAEMTEMRIQRQCLAIIVKNDFEAIRDQDGFETLELTVARKCRKTPELVKIIMSLLSRKSA